MFGLFILITWNRFKLKDGKEWYIMDSAWIATWLAYVHFDKDVAPAPGPCKSEQLILDHDNLNGIYWSLPGRNNRLIAFDYQLQRYTGRFGLLMAVAERGGDYRRVSQAVWEKFCE